MRIFQKTITIIIILFWINISDALIDCSQCHTTEPGKSSIKAKDTIVINDTTCLKCHNSNYPPTPIGYNTHLAHVGKFSAKVNFLARHPDVAKSLQCSDCHKQIFDCTNCHVNGIPHVQPPLGYNCQGCHGQIDRLFQHPTINLTIHNIFQLNSAKDCQMCHNPDSMKSLKLASGDIVPIDQAFNLCKQCHSIIFKAWDNGEHYANKTLPTDEIYREDPATQANFENNWAIKNTCVNCHNPHSPNQLYVILSPITKRAEPIPIYYYLIPLIAVFATILFVFKHYNFDPRKSISKLSSSIGSIKLPKLSLPISVTVEDEVAENSLKIDKTKKLDEELTEFIEKETERPKTDNIETDNIETDKIETEKIIKPDEKPINKLDEKLTNLIERDTTENKGKKVTTKILKKLNKGDLLFIAIIIGMFSTFYLVFGTFMPISVAISESMVPHIEKGDLIFYTDISRIDNIKTYNNELNKYSSFESYGDVIIYEPFGLDNVTPIIHRAMYYVNEGDPMWPGGPKAPTDGYITRGDNQVTNNYYDQEVSISKNQPVKKEWVKGIARFRIPYIGYIRLWI